VELSKQEEQMVKKIRKAKWFVFLRQRRHELFDEALQKELASLYRKAERGHPPVAPAILALALILLLRSSLGLKKGKRLVESYQLALSFTFILSPMRNAAVGYLFGRGKRAAFGAGSLLVGVYDPERDLFVTVTKFGTGLSDEQWRSIRERTRGLEVDHRPVRVSSLIEPSVWVEPQLVIEVLADEITRSPTHTAGKVGAEPGYALRFLRLVSFREADKQPEDATTVQELIELYQSQGKQ
jgi:hypothetical protein